MSVPKSAARMDYWREYFGSANANIFEIIEGAIMMAASDYPKEFRIRRDRIAQTLFSCKLIKCSGCDKEELALPVDDNADDDDAGDDGDEGVKYKSKLTGADGNWSKESSKVINCSRNDDDDDDDDDEEEDDDDHRDVEVNEHNNHVSNYSYGDAEALTNEIEEESQMFDEVMRIKEIVDNSPDESAFDLCNSLRKLQLMNLSVETLKATEIGKSVNVLRKHASKDVRQVARTLIEVWKVMVDEWVNATTKPTVSENTPESMNPSVLDEEEGLPSPPLDDLTFLNPHTMSLELSEKFFDGMDDYGNPRNNGEFNKNHNNNGKPAVEKQNVTKLKQQKPLNGPPMVRKEDHDSIVMKQPTGVKATRPPVANLAPQIKSNAKLQNPEKPTFPKKPIAPQQRKPWRAGGVNVQDKLEETKRKLQERYQQAENAKRQRTIQVMELHDLPKQDVQNVDRKNQHMRPGNNHNRHWAHGRC